MSTATINCTLNKDITVYQDDPTGNYYLGYLSVGQDSINSPGQSGAEYYGRIFLHFNLGSLSGMTINSAYLRMNCFWGAIGYGSFTVYVHKGTADYDPTAITWYTQPSVGSAISSAVITSTGYVDFTGLGSNVSSSLGAGYIVLCLNDDAYQTPYDAAFMQTNWGSTNVQLIVDYTASTYPGDVTNASLLANACGDASPPYDGTTIRGSTASSNANEYLITTGGSSITPTSITQSTTTNITFNPGSGAQVGRISTGRTYAWSKVSGITGTLGSISSNPCTLNCAGTGTYTIQCSYNDPFNGTVVKQQAITVGGA